MTPNRVTITHNRVDEYFIRGYTFLVDDITRLNCYGVTIGIMFIISYIVFENTCVGDKYCEYHSEYQHKYYKYLQHYAIYDINLPYYNITNNNTHYTPHTVSVDLIYSKYNIYHYIIWSMILITHIFNSYTMIRQWFSNSIANRFRLINSYIIIWKIICRMLITQVVLLFYIIGTICLYFVLIASPTLLISILNVNNLLTDDNNIWKFEQQKKNNHFY